MEAAKFGHAAHGEAAQEPPQRRRVGIGRQPREGLEGTVSAQQPSRFETSKPQDNRVQQREQHLRDAVRIIALPESHLGVEALAQTEPMEEAVQQKDATVPGQMIAREGHTDTSEAPPMPHAAPQKA